MAGRAGAPLREPPAAPTTGPQCAPWSAAAAAARARVLYVGGSQGGGAIHLTVGGTLRVDGRLGANGNAGSQDDSGGGAGGAVWVTAAALAGSGSINADGGAGEFLNGGGGGGGRIALYSPLNTFTGTVSVVGGVGASPGDDGTFYSSGTLEEPMIVSQTPSGLVSNAVSSVDLMFNTAVNPFTATASDVVVQTPIGMLAQSNLTVTALSPALLRVSFPQQTTVGDYSIQVGTQLENLSGQPMAQAYTGTFSIMLPAVLGVVTNSDGQAVAGVVLQPDGGQSAATTDANGAYSVGVING